jgi:hypothetical protein
MKDLKPAALGLGLEALEKSESYCAEEKQEYREKH